MSDFNIHPPRVYAILMKGQWIDVEPGTFRVDINEPFVSSRRFTCILPGGADERLVGFMPQLSAVKETPGTDKDPVQSMVQDLMRIWKS